MVSISAYPLQNILASDVAEGQEREKEKKMNNNINKIQNVQINEGTSRTVEVGFGRKVVLKNNLRPEISNETPAVVNEKKAYSGRTFGSMTGLFGVSKVDQLKKMMDQHKVA